MLYHLLVPLADGITAFNVFRYITFRSIGAALTALLISFVIGPLLIRKLEQRQLGQTIRDDPPERHKKKAGTPTMGGVLILLALLSSTLLWAEWTNPYVWIISGATLGCGVIGFVDDYRKAVHKNPKGISARQKFVSQVLVASVAATAIYLSPGFDTQLSLPLFKNFHPNLGLLYIPWAVLFIVGFSNAVNLTDGLDGLAIAPCFTTAAVAGVFAYAIGNTAHANYLDLNYVEGAGTLAIFCAALMGAALGFLWFNTYPASIFMGDTGALALGAGLGTLGVVIHQELVLVVAGGIFMAEMFSVIVQVLAFKTTGRRVFLMTPFHHHFELKGWPEPQIIVRFWIVSVILALVAAAFLKLR